MLSNLWITEHIGIENGILVTVGLVICGQCNLGCEVCSVFGEVGE